MSDRIELECEPLIEKICGENWRENPSEIDGVWGVAIVRSVLDGCFPSLKDVSHYLDIHVDLLRGAFTRLSLNGVFLRDRLYKDRKSLNNNDLHAWCYYAGVAQGVTGNILWEQKKK